MTPAQPPWPLALQGFDQDEGPLFERVEREVEAARGEARTAELKSGEAVQAGCCEGVEGAEGRGCGQLIAGADKAAN